MSSPWLDTPAILRLGPLWLGDTLILYIVYIGINECLCSWGALLRGYIHGYLHTHIIVLSRTSFWNTATLAGKRASFKLQTSPFCWIYTSSLYCDIYHHLSWSRCIRPDVLHGRENIERACILPQVAIV